MIHRYHAFGLSIASELELPELEADAATTRCSDTEGADVIIRVARIEVAMPPNAVGTERSWGTADDLLLRFDEGGRFFVSGGKQILVDRAVHADDIAVRLFLLGPVLGSLLHQRGELVLHASAVTMNGGAVAFLAEKGCGKSTLAAAFHAHGHQLVSDDIVPVRFVDDGLPITFPGFPQFKLLPEAAEQLGGTPHDLPRLLPNSEKRAKRLNTAFSLHSLPLRALYVLEDGESERIAPLPAKQALMLLVQHTFVLPLLRATSGQASHLEQSSRLLRLIGVRTLQRRRTLSLLPDVVRLVEDDLARM